MTSTPFATLKEAKNSLIRKTLDGIVAYAPMSADPLDESFADATGINALPAGWLQVGKCTDDGAQFARSVDVSTVSSWGDTAPSREDVKTDTTTLAAVMNETNAASIGLYTGVDLPDAAAVTGVLMIDKPTIPQLSTMRAAAIGMDRSPGGEIYMVRFLPSAKITDYADQAMQSDSDDALTWGVTWTSFVDDDLGTAERWLFGGPGWLALLDDMGITQAVGG
jgi:hypothetical protein